MAEIPYTMVPTGQEVEGTTLLKWAGMQNTDTGTPFKFAHQNDRTVHVFGTFVGGCNRGSVEFFYQLKHAWKKI